MIDQHTYTWSSIMNFQPIPITTQIFIYKGSVF